MQTSNYRNQIKRWSENEDWVELISRSQLAHLGDGRYETTVNFGGPMARTSYHIYARLITGSSDAVSSVEIDGEAVDRSGTGVMVSGTPPGYRWIYLGRFSSERGYRKMTVTSPEGLESLDRICMLQVPERLESGAVERRIAREESGSPEPLSGVPLGGVGAGKIEICRDGLFRNITINGNIDAPIWLSRGTFFAVRSESGGIVKGRIISTESMHGLDAVSSIDFNGIYPKATLRVEDPEIPLIIDIQANGTIIPRNIKDSALPLTLFTVKLTARKDKAVRAAIAFSVENLLGCGGGLSPGLTERSTLSEGFYEVWEERSGNTEAAWKSEKFSGVMLDSGEKEEKRSEGQYVLATDSPLSTRLTGWRVDESADVWRRFLKTGRFPSISGGPSTGERTAGAVAVEVNLQPGESREMRFVLAWHVPVFWQSPVMEYGHYYSNYFRSAEEVAVYGLNNFERLRDESSELPDLLMQSSLPRWFSRSLANDAFPFSTNSWLTKDGRFAINEGPTHMFGCMGTLDQKLYANHYYSLFFPELDRTELLGFARAQAPNGGVQHDLGSGHLEIKGQHCQWPDLTCALAILSLKHYQLTGDQEYIDEVYPKLIPAILDYHAMMDHDGDGLADGPEVGNTFDSEHFEGVSCYTATVTLAALKSLEELARRRGDDETAARCRKTFERARKSAMKLLWNDKYFISYYNTANGKVNGNCHVSQLAGEMFSWICGLGPLYDESNAREALESILQLNYPDNLVFPTNEATPDGKMASRHMWGWLPHVRTVIGGLPAFFGMADNGLKALEKMDRVIGEINEDNRWDLRLFYEPDTGKQHWGRFYMSAPATWYCYQAYAGYTWDQPQGILRLTPHVPESLLPLSTPVFVPGFWGWLDVSGDRRTMQLRIIKRFDAGLMIKRLRVPKQSGSVEVFVDGSRVNAERAEVQTDTDDVLCSINLDETNDIRIAWSQ